MAKRTGRDAPGQTKNFGAPEFSLESILEEYRDNSAEPEPEYAPAENAYPAETEVVPEPAEYPEEAETPAEEAEYPQETEYAENAPEEYDEDQPDAYSSDADGEANFYGQPSGFYAEDAASAAETDEGSAVAEDFADDAEFYAPPPENEEAAAESAPEEAGAVSGRSKWKKRKERSSRGRSGGIWGRIMGAVAAASIRRAGNMSQPDPEPEDAELEMPPRRAAKFYAVQMPSLRLRFFGAAAVCVLLAWITIASGFGWPLPGGLGTNVKSTSLVCLVGMFAVMLLGLDVVTAGIMSIVRGRAGAESMIVVSAFAAVLDVLFGGTSHGITFAVIPASAVCFALRGAWYSCRAYSDTFLAAFHAKGPYAVTSEVFSEKKGRILIKSRRSADGLVRRSEEPNDAETLASVAFLPMVAAALVLSVIFSVGSGDIRAVFHIFSMMTALCVSFNWTLAFPMLFARTARHLMMHGSALAGWSGARDVGRSRQLVLTDTDIFPEDTVEITGVRILDKSQTDRIVSFTGSMLQEAGTGTAAAFAELMRRRKVTAQSVENFTVGEGGACGTIAGTEVRIGSLGYMHLCGVKIPDTLKEECAVYTAADGELMGVFLVHYRPMASVQRALADLRREHRKPIFAIRDFNIDPLLLQKTFGISTEGFQFPSFAERYRISGIPASAGSPVSGVMAQDGLDTLVDYAECGTMLYFYGRVCAWTNIACALVGILPTIVPIWQGSWDIITAGRILLYMILWLIVPIALRELLRK